ncbi:MAG TPA: VWA domain-containing protein [Prosthecobacter sp.]
MISALHPSAIRHFAAALTGAFLSCAGIGLAETTSVQLILDCSGSMWNKLGDGRYRIDAAKQVLSEFIATAPEKEGLHIGLRLYGSKVSHRDSAACEDTWLAVPVEGFQRAEMLRLVKEARAIGATPLALSLNAAADDLTKPGKKQVIVFTDGEESCGGDVAAALAKLKSDGIDADVRIIGIGLPKAVAERFATLAPIENADSAVRLAEALKNAAAVTMAAPAAPMVKKEKVSVKIMKNGEPAGGGAVRLSGTDAALFDLVKTEEPGVWSGELAPGVYTATVAPSGRKFTDLIVVRDTENAFELDITELPKVNVEVLSEEVVAVRDFAVSFAGANGTGDQYIIIAPVGSSDPSEPNLRDAIGKEATLTLTAPDTPGMYEARFTVRGKDSRQIVCGRSKPFEVKPPQVVLEMPATVASSTPITVKYKANVQNGDWIGWTKAGAEDGAYQLYVRPTAETDKVEVSAPAEPGDYEMRYATDGSIKPFARKAFKVEAAAFSLEAPESAAAGTHVKIAWKAPVVSNLYVTIVPKGAEVGAYNEYARLHVAENPVNLQAPRKSGEMEIRIMDEVQNKLLFSRPIRLTDLKASVSGPQEASPGASITVTWTGPNGDGDFITIAKAGSPKDAYLDYDYTRNADPAAQLTTPEEAGEYEIRYTTQDSQVIAQQPLRIK